MATRRAAATSLLAGLAAPAHCWSRLNVGGKTPPITCGGAVLTEQIKKNVRGENPDVPVSIIARYPLLDPFIKYLSDFHVYCALLLMFVVYLQFILPKGTVKSWAAEERKGLSKEMSALLSKRAVVIQSDALARHEKGEDVTSAAELLQVIVDMTVQVQLLVKRASESA